jgi:hypothetical protein
MAPILLQKSKIEHIDRAAEGCLVVVDGKEIATSRIMYETAPVTKSADQALAALEDHGESRSGKEEAVDFLTDLLVGGPVSAKDVMKEAANAGITTKSRACDRPHHRGEEKLSRKACLLGWGRQNGPSLAGIVATPPSAPLPISPRHANCFPACRAGREPEQLIKALPRSRGSRYRAHQLMSSQRVASARASRQ